MQDRDLARILFDAHNASTGGLTHDGKPIPTWEQIESSRPHVIQAWIDAARAGREALELENARIAGENYRIGIRELERVNPESAALFRRMFGPPVILQVECPSTPEDQARIRKAVEELRGSRIVGTRSAGADGGDFESKGCIY